MRFAHLVPLTFFALAAAHSLHQRRVPSIEELAREEIRAREHVVKARNCEPEMREQLNKRMARRDEIMKREANAVGGTVYFPRSHYTSIQNTTCLTAPEVTEGPYYVNNEYARQDIRESQKGVTLLMDFGVMDTSTCTPIDNAFVEIWHANATGWYGAYATNQFNGSETFLRGGWYTDSNGMVEITTIYPGYYAGRTAHIHLMVRTNWTKSTNGTIVSNSGSLVHVGQTFFEESWNNQVFNTTPYTSDANPRTTNDEDSILTSAFQNGYNAYTSLQYLNGQDLSGGLVGYLTLGVDTSSTHTVDNRNYNTGGLLVSNSTSSSNGTSSGGSNSTSNKGSSNSSGAESRWKGWGNTFCLSLLAFAFLGYKAQLHVA